MAHVPATAADPLLREALTALDTCLATLAQLGERAKVMEQQTEAAHRRMRRYMNDFGMTTPPAETSVQTPARTNSGPFSVDHEAIYRDELALQQTAARLRAVQGKVEHLTNLVRAGRAQALGSDSAALDNAPWAAAVRAARIEAQEEERMRLAREVHDGPAQVLANAILGLEYCELVAARAPQELGAELHRLRTAMREGLVEVRRFMFDLRPTTLASMGLSATLLRYAEEYHQAFGIPVQLALPDQEPAMDVSVQIAVFRIVQESLQNVHKHAEASAVRIELESQADELVYLRIVDNGMGFDTKRARPASSSGAGLLGMVERAGLLGGRLTVESAPGRGTTIALCIPARAGQTAENNLQAMEPPPAANGQALSSHETIQDASTDGPTLALEPGA